MATRDTLEIGGIRWRLGPGADPGAVEKRLRAAQEALASGRARERKAVAGKRLFELALGRAAPADHLLKRRAGSPWPALPGCSKARRELAVASGLAARGVAVVVPLAAGERRRGGRLCEAWLLSAIVDGARDLRVLARTEPCPLLTPAERRALAAALGALVRRAHDAGLLQEDPAPNNVLARVPAVPGEPAGPWLIDFERAALRRRVGRGARRRMLAKLARALPEESAGQRMRFLRAYARGDAAEARRWWRDLRAFAPRLAARDHARLRRVATRDGRRFRRVAQAGWRGYARRRAPLADLLGALPSAPAAAGVARAAARWEIAYPGVRERRLRELWARANTLFARGLGPRPLALLVRGGGGLLVTERPAGATLAAEVSPSRDAAAAVARLLRRLGEIGELPDALAGDAIALAPGAGARRAWLLRPEAIRFRGRAAGSDPRARADALRAALHGPG